MFYRAAQVALRVGALFHAVLECHDTTQCRTEVEPETNHVKFHYILATSCFRPSDLVLKSLQICR